MVHGSSSALEALKQQRVEVIFMGAYGEECFTTLQKVLQTIEVSVAVSPSELVNLAMKQLTEHFEGKTNIQIDKHNLDLLMLKILTNI